MNIYVSGPMTTDSKGKLHGSAEITLLNVMKAKAIGMKLAKLGYVPYVPHTHIGGWESELNYENIMRIHLTFIRKWADALLFLGPSRGADIEKEEAEKCGIPVFNSIKNLAEASFIQKPSLCRLNGQQLLLLQQQL